MNAITTLSPLDTTDALFFGTTLDRGVAEATVRDALDGMDDGELFLEYRESEGLSLEDGRIRSASFDTQLGFGLRAVLGDEAGYAHAGELTEGALARAAATVQGVRAGRSGTVAEAAAGNQQPAVRAGQPAQHRFYGPDRDAGCDRRLRPRQRPRA